MTFTQTYAIQMTRCAAIVSITALLAACASPPTRFYTLATPLSPAATSSAAARPATLLIDVLPVAVPENLARPQLVLGQQSGGGARIDVLEADRWSSPFNNELRDALSAGLTARLGATDVARGGRSGQPVWRIAVSLRQLSAVRGERVQASYSWTVSHSDDGRISACQLTVSEAVQGADLDALVQGVQRTVAQATGAIAATVEALAAGSKTACGG
ncbi:PqiC family protein [Herbaspirillum sp. RTI4]|uniref:PqiC family protein n=1 Tax=Herbaspirillum sp. RTI4 TaxID=3048640 RepID=UPI002AB5A97F|nr:PqiC family protein [Herbaspirillum sp. RTI4]MDY7579627.1 PqiC family protein [Herbaspirillum sp. RTI4]MEA9981842.1 PqiC family protein [Herbaspirillum sp. RTI4]